MSERYDFTPYRFSRLPLPCWILHRSGRCGYHPYAQESDVRIADVDVTRYSFSRELREFTERSIAAAQRRLRSHGIDWTDPRVLAEVERREGTWVQVNPSLSEKRRPPDAVYWKPRKDAGPR